MSRTDWISRERELAKSHRRQLYILVSIGIPLILFVVFLVT